MSGTNNKIQPLQQNKKKILDYYELTEEDFYPPEDKRTFHSGVRNIHGGDNFEDYIKYFYELYEDEIF